MGAAGRARQPGAMNATTSSPSPETDTATDFQDEPPRYAAQRLRRPIHDRMVAGVAAAIADYLDVDVTIVRIVIAVLTVAGGAGVAVYIAGWLLIPEEGADHSIADDFLGSIGSRSR
jgi:phage shock protein PspC (stress-responsive transcriptional regulator)